jgi:uncharacterized protein with GYD domain
VTAADLTEYIARHRIATGRLPRLRECVEHFGGKLLNVMLRLGEIDKATADEIRKAAAEERRNRKAKEA